MHPDTPSTNQSIFGIFISFFFIFIVSIIIVGVIVYTRQSARINTHLTQDLPALTELKTIQLTNWYSEQMSNAATLSNAFVVENHSAFSRVHQEMSRKMIRSWLEDKNKAFQYKNIMLVDHAGTILVAASPSSVTGPLFSSSITEALQKGKALFVDLHLDETGKFPGCEIIVPLFGSGVPAGALIFQIDPNRALYPLVSKWPVTSMSPDSFLVRSAGDESILLSASKLEKDAVPFKPLSSTSAIKAALACGGGTEGEDRSKVPIIAVALPVPNTPWMLVALIKKGEMYAPVRAVIGHALMLIGSLSAVAGLLWYRQRSTILREMIRLNEEANSLELRYRYLTKYANDIILLTDDALNIVEANDRALETYGYSNSELLRMNLLQLHAEGAAALAREHLNRLSVHDGIAFDTIHRSYARSDFPVEVSIRQAMVEGEALCFCVIRDITERKAAAERILKLNYELESKVADRTKQLEAVNRELELTNKELEAFSYSVSHDLRAPLRSIDGFSLALIEDYEHLLDGKARDYLQRVRAATQHMARLIDDMLRLSHVARAGMRFETVSLSDIAAEVVRGLRELYPERKVDSVIDGDIIVCADSALLRILFENLIGNAWKFTSLNSAALVKTGFEYCGGERVFYVRDNGIGFNMKYAKKIFQPFMRFHSMKEFPGTGIGLATAERVVRRHHGRIWVESTEGQGTAVFFTLEEKEHGKERDTAC
ncbi:MAG: hypothetical protein A2293_05530 [Elusimicrobia bacterium RIFOXYB2_FULL_49_7]|nr:MAG: hypothetical protein A2293_05530 [Elusimicrobia bacterium RIFOXYB2_FULL_49_7]